MLTKVVVSALLLGAAVGLATRHARTDTRPSHRAAQEFPYYPYDGSWTFIRVHTNQGMRGFGGRYSRGGWSHDYPDAEINLSGIVGEVTSVAVRSLPYGGNILTFEDPRLMSFPIAYVSEPDEWTVTDGEAKALRTYLLKGGFVIFDDFFEFEMQNLVVQMSRVFPELHFQRMLGNEPIWRTFFEIEPGKIVLEGPRKNGTPIFWGLYEQNDRSKRLLAIAGAGADIGDLWEWSGRGFYPIGPTDHAFRIGVNYIIYALSH